MNFDTLNLKTALKYDNSITGVYPLEKIIEDF